jgi:serine/threonine protein kinase
MSYLADSLSIITVDPKLVLFNETYELGAEIGSGQFSTVRVARKLEDNSQVAVKIVQKNEDNNLALLAKEISVLSKIRHHAILRMLETYETTEQIYLVTKRAVGGELFDLIQSQGCISEPSCRDVATKLLSALAYLQRRRIVSSRAPHSLYTILTTLYSPYYTLYYSSSTET